MKRLAFLSVAFMVAAAFFLLRDQKSNENNFSSQANLKEDIVVQSAHQQHDEKGPVQAANTISETHDSSSEDKVVENEAKSIRKITKPNEDLSWFYEPQSDDEFSISDPKYDNHVFHFSKLRSRENPWLEYTMRPFNVSKPYFSTLYPLKDPKRQIHFNLKLRRDERGRDLLPESIQVSEKDSEQGNFSYSEFISKFKEQEIYFGLLSFPYDSFWKQIDPTLKCDEIALINEVVGMTSGEDFMTKFTGRVFCRNDQIKMNGIAHFIGKTSP